MAALAALAAATCSANEVDIRLDRVSLYELVRLVLGELLHEPYVVEGAVIGVEDVATVDARRIEPATARQMLENLLKARGFALEAHAGVTVVKRADKRADKERLWIYRPKYRSVSYLQGAARSFVLNGRFAGMAPSISAGQAAGANAQAPAVGGDQGRGGAQSAVSSLVPAQGAVLASQDVLVFEGTDADVAKLERLVTELDRPTREVVVKAYVLEVGSNASDGSGVSLAVNLLGGRLSVSTASAAAPSSVTLRFGGVEAAYAVLRSDARFRVLSSPTLRIKNGERGRLTVGSEVPVLGAVSVSSTGQPVQSVEYRSSGVILDLKAEILEGAVGLVVQQQVSTFVATTTGVNASPTLLKRELTTTLSMKSGEVVVMGGLEDGRASESGSGPSGFFSFLGMRLREDSRSELILLLEATAMDDS